MVRLTPPPLLPPAQVPDLPALRAASVDLRPLTAADGAAAFAVAEEALRWPEPLTTGERQAQQHHWSSTMRLWSGWLQATAGGTAWGAFVAGRSANHLVGYARAFRDADAKIEYLTELFVRPAFQHAHIGHRLLAAVLAPAVPPGWRRLIVAHPQPGPLALYHRWQTFPLASAWYLAWRPPAQASTTSHTRPMEHFPGGHLRPIAPARDLATLDWLDRQLLGRVRPGQHGFMLGVTGSTGVILEQHGMAVAYGLRTGEQVGPVIGATPHDTLVVLRALLGQSRQAAGDLPGCWVPGANTTALTWARAAAPSVILAGQVVLMASEPALLTGLDRAILTAPPYLG